jgi:hypothetical protein
MTGIEVSTWVVETTSVIFTLMFGCAPPSNNGQGNREFKIKSVKYFSKGNFRVANPSFSRQEERPK